MLLGNRESEISQIHDRCIHKSEEHIKDQYFTQKCFELKWVRDIPGHEKDVRLLTCRVHFVPAITHSKPLMVIGTSTLYPDASSGSKGIFWLFQNNDYIEDMLEIPDFTTPCVMLLCVKLRSRDQSLG